MMNSLLSILLIIGPLIYNGDKDQTNFTNLTFLNDQLCGVSLQWPNGNDRIVGGRVALDGEFPWQVSIRRYSPIAGDFVHICGGSIIADQWILTAAHCTNGIPKENFRIVGNVTHFSNLKVQEHKVRRILIHTDFNDDNNANDISLIQLESSLNLDKSYGHMGAVCLSNSLDESGLIRDGRSVNFVTVSGWGSTDEEGDSTVDLLATEVALVETERCNLTYNGDVAKGFICAGLIEGGKDSCQGDSGGPMIYRDSNNRAHQIGIVSWGEGCGRRGIPGVYTDVQYYLDWIISTIGQYDIKN